MTWMQLAHGLRLDPVAKGSPEAPVARLHDAADSAATLSPFAARGARRPVDISSTPRAASQSIDASLYLFALCRHLQTIALDRRGIDCLSDAEGAGRLPEAACRMLGSMVCELAKDAGACSQPATARRTITVTLRRRGTICLCTVSGQGRMGSHEDAQPGLQRVRQLAAELRGGCMVRSMPDRGITAIMFDVLSIERSFPAPVSRHRAAA